MPDQGAACVLSLLALWPTGSRLTHTHTHTRMHTYVCTQTTCVNQNIYATHTHSHTHTPHTQAAEALSQPAPRPTGSRHPLLRGLVSVDMSERESVAGRRVNERGQHVQHAVSNDVEAVSLYTPLSLCLRWFF